MPYGRSYGVTQRTASRRKSYLGGVVQRRRKAVATSRLKLAQPVRKLVDRRIDRQIETKVAIKYFRRTGWDNVPDTQARCINMFPNLNQGYERSEREGSKIKLLTLRCQGYIQIPSYFSEESNDRSNIMFRLCCLSAKSESFYPDVLANWQGTGNYFDQLLKELSESAPPTGVNRDMWAEINRDLFTVHYDKLFNFSRGDQFGLDPASGATWRPDMIKFFKFNMKVKNRVLRFAQDTQPGTNDGIQPTNFAPFLVGWWSYTNGAPASNIAVPYVEFYNHIKFKDA